jgi:hypothetical protein
MITGSDLRISLSSLRRKGRRRRRRRRRRIVETNAEYAVLFVTFKAGD